MPGKRTLLNRD